MFNFDNKIYYIPAVGPFSFKDIKLFSYKYNIELNSKINRKAFNKYKSKLEEYYQNLGYIIFLDEKSLISMDEINKNHLTGKIDDKNFSLISNNKYFDSSYVKINSYIIQIITKIFETLIKPDLLYKEKQRYILKNKKIVENNHNKLKIKLIGNKAVRISTILDVDKKRFLILLYPSYRVIVEPNVENLISYGLDVKGLSVVSNKDGVIYSGTIEDIITDPNKDPLAKCEIENLRDQFSSKNEKILDNETLIKISSADRKKDKLIPARFYNIQVKMDENFLENQCNFELTKIQKFFQHTPESFYKDIEPIRDRFEKELINYFSLDDSGVTEVND
ncbi:MAG: hypothetical protein ACTSRP_10790 [Candidatus Helarchaeota archaeon]